MRVMTAALAGAAIFLGGCDGSVAPEEESRSEAETSETEEPGADSDENDSGEEADRE